MIDNINNFMKKMPIPHIDMPNIDILETFESPESIKLSEIINLQSEMINKQTEIINKQSETINHLVEMIENQKTEIIIQQTMISDSKKDSKEARIFLIISIVIAIIALLR